MSRDAPNYGLTDRQVDVLMRSSDSEHLARVQMPTGVFEYQAQITPDADTAAELEAIGLITTTSTPDGVVFAWTPQGIALTQRLGNP